MMLLFATMLLLLTRRETPLKATKATTTMLLPAAAVCALAASRCLCALAASRCCPLEVLAGTSRPPVSLGSSSGCASRAAEGAAVRG
ncbi:hypothetical protein T492DRAFT_1087051, partial [Pavlovales sp. CCMP2436]